MKLRAEPEPIDDLDGGAAAGSDHEEQTAAARIDGDVELGGCEQPASGARERSVELGPRHAAAHDIVVNAEANEWDERAPRSTIAQLGAVPAQREVGFDRLRHRRDSATPEMRLSSVEPGDCPSVQSVIEYLEIDDVESQIAAGQPRRP